MSSLPESGNLREGGPYLFAKAERLQVSSCSSCSFSTDVPAIVHLDALYRVASSFDQCVFFDSAFVWKRSVGGDQLYCVCGSARSLSRWSNCALPLDHTI